MSIEKLLPARKSQTVFDPITGLTEKVSQITTSRSFNDEKIGQLVVATESLGSNEEQIISSVYNNLESTIKTIAQDFGVSLESFQLEAATIAGMLGTNPRAFLASKPKTPNVNGIVIQPSVADGYMERIGVSLEAYDERENRNAQLYSIVYNLLSSRQDDFGETFFPTIVVNPNEVGITLSVKLFYVYNDFKRSITGALANYARKNVVRAYADPTILRNELTRAIPVLRVGGEDDNTALFVPNTDVAPWSVEVGNGITVTTSAVKVDSKYDLIGVSQTNELLNSGIMGPSDTLDTVIRLESVYIKVTDGTKTDVIRVMTDHLPGATFTYAPQGNYRKMILNLDTDAIVLDSSTVNVSGVAPASLPELAAHSARVHLSMTGSVVIDKGETLVNKGSIGLAVVRNSTGQLVTSGAAYTALKGKINDAQIIGYTLYANRANSNLRQRGQLVDSQVEYRIVNVPYRSPISSIMPAINTTDGDTSALQTLITLTCIRVSNEAVGALIRADGVLYGYKAVADAAGNLPEIGAIGEYYVKPVYFRDTLDLAQTVDSLKSHERIKDIRAAIVEKIRYYANEMYRLSEYKAAALVLTGNAGFKPTVIVGTDPVIYNYIMVDGDLRTLGDTFDVRVVSSLDERVKGKIFVTFGVFDSSRNTSINPLNFGNMLWSPELVANMPISRDGAISRELIVAPRFYHMVNLPVLTRLDVTGLPATVAKVPVNMRSV